MIYLDYETAKIHIASAAEEKASWPASACGINREKGRPWITRTLPQKPICETCRRIRGV
jgi:hypothetical protein